MTIRKVYYNMKLFRELYRRLIVYRRFPKETIIGKGSIVTKSCRLEGANRVDMGSFLANTTLGYGTYLGNNCIVDRCKIGRYSSVGPRFRIVQGFHPTDIFVSTHPAFYSIRKQCGITYVESDKYQELRLLDGWYAVEIGNDVWIGADAIVMAGTKIADGAIIAAGAVVTKDVPPYAIVGGVPAKVIRYRHNEKQCDKLLQIRWWDKDNEWIKSHAEMFQDIDAFLTYCESEEKRND